MSDEPYDILKRFRRHFKTPPPVVYDEAAHHKHLLTPQRAAVLGAVYYCDMLRIPCSFDNVQKAFKIPSSTISRIVNSREPRTLKHTDKPDSRGAIRQLTGAEAFAIIDFLDHCSFEEKAETW